jgi:hypothetical protein
MKAAHPLRSDQHCAAYAAHLSDNASQSFPAKKFPAVFQSSLDCFPQSMAAQLSQKLNDAMRFCSCIHDLVYCLTQFATPP